MLGFTQVEVEAMAIPYGRAALRAVYAERSRQAEQQAELMTAILKALVGG